MADTTVEYGKNTLRELQNIQRYGYSFPTIFSDFIESVMAMLLSATDNMQRSNYETFKEKVQQGTFDGEYEDRYMQVVKKYKENNTGEEGQRPADYFAQAWSYLQEETERSQRDILGEIYEREISTGANGQYFTPAHIAGLLGQLVGSSGQRAIEPSCGGGGLIIAAAQSNPDRHFTGVEISPICARMAVVNMWLFGINADIYQGDMLSAKMHCLWRVRRGGYVWEHTSK